MKKKKLKEAKFHTEHGNDEVITIKKYNDDRTTAFKVIRQKHRPDSIAWVVSSVFMFIFLVLALGRLTIIGQLIDDVIFSFLFGWIKYIAYLVFFGINFTIVFGLKFKFKKRFILMLVTTWLVVVWVLSACWMLSLYPDQLWKADMFSTTMKDYFQNWQDHSIFGETFKFASPSKFAYWQHNLAYANLGQTGGIFGSIIASGFSYLSLPVSLILATFALLVDLVWILTGNPLYIFLPKAKRKGKKLRILSLKQKANPHIKEKPKKWEERPKAIIVHDAVETPQTINLNETPVSQPQQVFLRETSSISNFDDFEQPKSFGWIEEDDNTFEFKNYSEELAENFYQRSEKVKPKLKTPEEVLQEQKAEFENLNQQEVRQKFAREFSDIRPYGIIEEKIIIENYSTNSLNEEITDLVDDTDFLNELMDETNDSVDQTYEEDETTIETTMQSYDQDDSTNFSDEVVDDETPIYFEKEKYVEKNISSSINSIVKPNYKPDYLLPVLELLDDVKQDRRLIIDNQYYAQEKKQAIDQTFNQFKVAAKVVNIIFGPAVIKFEIQPDPGTKVNSISALENDLKLALASQNIRIEAPIPGKNLVGIEIESKNRLLVGLKDMMVEADRIEPKNKLLFALGKDVQGRPVFGELNKMPHLLVAGATGSGKSVMINTLIISILLRAKPDEVKFLLIDPKKVELAIYTRVPHLLTPVISDMKEANKALKVIIAEMERRYELFAQNSVKNLESYNKKNPTTQLPYYVVIIDELADLMMTANKKDVEDSIMRITQMARAAGIHLIVATQRPSVDVLTGVIKANMPTRIAFSVTTGTDSRTILDSVGAEKLTGKGDMLYIPPGTSELVRAQGAYLSDDEIERVIDFIVKQEQATYEESFLTQMQSLTNDGNYGDDESLYHEIKNWVLTNRKASVSLLQRKFSLGWNKAANYIDKLEAEGIIGPQNGAKPREVLE